MHGADYGEKVDCVKRRASEYFTLAVRRVRR